MSAPALDTRVADHHMFAQRAQGQAPTPKPIERKIGHPPVALDLQFVSFRPTNMFQKVCKKTVYCPDGV